jgi:DNA-binding response OmpR family regulator
LAELLARVRALLRRSVPDALEVGGVRMDLAGRRVLIDGTEVGLANKEFELLRVLLSRSGQVVSREEILREVWKGLELKNTKTLDMHMSWLRRKIGSSRVSLRCTVEMSRNRRSVPSCGGGSCSPR